MQRTRLEIANLLKKSERNLRETQEIHRQLQLLMVYIERLMASKSSLKRKAPK